MELSDFIKHYLPDYEKRFDKLKRQYEWWDRDVTKDVINSWYAENFKEAYYNFLSDK